MKFQRSSFAFTFILIITLLTLSIIAQSVSAQYVRQGNYYVDNSTNIKVTLIDMNNNYIFKSPYSGFDVCRCGTVSDVVEITNTGSYDSMYTLTSDKNYVTFAEPSVEVKAGHTKTIPVYMNMPCNAGHSETVKLYAKSSFQQTKVLEQKITMRDCQNLVAGVYEQNLNTSICTPFSTSIRIKNTGAFNEVYHIDVNKFGKYATLSTDDILISSGQSADVFIHYALPCDISGHQELSYTVTATKNDMRAKLHQSLYIPPNYNFSVIGPKSLSACDRTESSYEVILRNNNDFSDTYTFVVSKPQFVDVHYPVVEDEEVKTLKLAPSAEASLIFTINNPQKKYVGSHPITVKVISKNGHVAKELITNFTVINCVDLSSEIFTSDGNLHLCGGDDLTFQSVVENHGFTPASNILPVLLDGSNYLSTNISDEITIHGPQSVNVPIHALVPSSVNESSEYFANLQTYFNAKIENENKFKVFVDPAEKCYHVKTLRDEITRYYEVDGFELNIKNDGLRSGRYLVRIANKPSYLNLLTPVIDINSGEKAKIYFAINQTNLQGIAQSMDTLPDEFYTHSKIMFIHEESGVITSQDLELRLMTSHPWYINAWSAVQRSSLCTKIFFLLSSVALLFLIMTLFRSFSSKRKWSGRKILGGILLAIVVIGAIFVLANQGVPTYSKFYTTYDLSTNSTRHVLLEEDHSKTLDLTQFFTDPDNDIVEYGVQEINDSLLTPTIEGSELKLSPAKDYNGASTMVLYATDAYNATAISEEIYVEVLPVEDYSIKEFFDLACEYIDWLVLLIASALVWITFSLRKEKKNKTKPSPKTSGYVRPKTTKKVSKKTVKKTTKKTTKKQSSKKAKVSKKTVAKKKSAKRK